MEYVSHKLTIVLYAAVMLCFFHTVLFRFRDWRKRSADIQDQLCYTALSDHVLHQSEVCTGGCFAAAIISKRKNQRKAKAGIAQREDFSRVGGVVIKDKQQWIGLIFRNAVK